MYNFLFYYFFYIYKSLYCHLLIILMPPCSKVLKENCFLTVISLKTVVYTIIRILSNFDIFSSYRMYIYKDQ